jgi:hypothetical protein
MKVTHALMLLIEYTFLLLENSISIKVLLLDAVTRHVSIEGIFTDK